MFVPLRKLVGKQFSIKFGGNEGDFPSGALFSIFLEISLSNQKSPTKLSRSCFESVNIFCENLIANV